MHTSLSSQCIQVYSVNVYKFIQSKYTSLSSQCIIICAVLIGCGGAGVLDTVCRTEHSVVGLDICWVKSRHYVRIKFESHKIIRCFVSHAFSICIFFILDLFNFDITNRTWAFCLNTHLLRRNMTIFV